MQNDISDVLDLTFSMDADEEKLILYEKAEVEHPYRPLPLSRYGGDSKYQHCAGN